MIKARRCKAPPARPSTKRWVLCAATLLGACGGPLDADGGFDASGSDRVASSDGTAPADIALDSSVAADVPEVPIDGPSIDEGVPLDVTMPLDAPSLDARVDTGVLDARTDTGVDVRVDSGAIVDVPTADRPTGTDTGVDAPSMSGGLESRTRAEVCARWVVDRAAGPSTEWTAGADRCANGTVAAATQPAALRILNGYRWLVGVDPVTIDPSLEAQQQSCAVMMAVNNMLSHSPPATWQCYSAAGATAAGSSNLALGTGAFGSVGLYINERGSDLGHRRWCLFPQLGPTYFGTANRASCMQVFRRNSGASVPNFVAYPNPGPAPIETFSSGVWHVQEARFRFSATGTVTVTDVATGMNMPVTMNPVTGMYGGGNAIAWRPNGWTPAVGTTYRVHVMPTTGMAFSYTTTPVMCP
jgi:hypothetical protein